MGSYLRSNLEMTKKSLEPVTVRSIVMGTADKMVVNRSVPTLRTQIFHQVLAKNHSDDILESQIA